MSQNPLKDAMPPRPLAARWVVRGTLTIETALHLGGEGAERVDIPVLRDPREGKPLLPGTTFAGALRSALADRLAGYGQVEPPEVAALFGGARGDDDGSQSPLIIFDALGDLPNAHGARAHGHARMHRLNRNGHATHGPRIRCGTMRVRESVPARRVQPAEFARIRIWGTMRICERVPQRGLRMGW